ncbi:hypothetical protein BJV77DRAFT_1001507 [Russula vinacea]|nr:hypothetical protein BJV77DRAFT_1001507 [Russula vinacea]
MQIRRGRKPSCQWSENSDIHGYWLKKAVVYCTNQWGMEETASTAWHLSPIQRHVHDLACDLVEVEIFSKGSSQMGRASWRQYQYKREEELGKKEKEGGIREMDGLFEGRSKRPTDAVQEGTGNGRAVFEATRRTLKRECSAFPMPTAKC